MAKIAIVGVGAIGGVIGALLHRTGRHELVLCVRSSFSELSVAGPTGTISVKAPTLTDPAAAPAVDWVMVCSKAYDAKATAKWFPRLRATGAPVAIVQNGVEHRERFAPYLPADSILPVMVDCPAERDGPGRVRMRGPMYLKVPESAQGAAFVKLFDGPGVEAGTVADFQSTVWRKLCGNSAGILSALLLRPTGAFHDESLAAVAREIVRECVRVGRAEGAKLNDDVPDAVVAGYRAAQPDSLNSLHADRLGGRPMEIDARNGAVIRLGQKHGIPTPYNSMAAALLEAAARLDTPLGRA